MRDDHTNLTQYILARWSITHIKFIRGCHIFTFRAIERGSNGST